MRQPLPLPLTVLSSNGKKDFLEQVGQSVISYTAGAKRDKD